MKRGSSFRSIFLASMWLIIDVMSALVVPIGARAQALQGEIDGNVTDSIQGAVVGARVVATNAETNFSRATVTNSAGAYALPDLPPGTYTISVTAPGFQTYNQTGIAVSPNAVRRRGANTITYPVAHYCITLRSSNGHRYKGDSK
jgi:uncharacterized protein (DUF2141 family)